MEKIIPTFLVNKIKEEYAEKDVELILRGLKSEKKTTFRVNKIKSNSQEIKAVLKENHILFSKLDFLEDAFVLENDNENKIRELEIYQEGKIYLQSLSSMIPVSILEPKEKENILDMCAAPRRKNITNCKRYRKQGIYYSMWKE